MKKTNNSKFNKKVEKYYDDKKNMVSKKIDLAKSYNSDTYVDKNGNHILELKDDNKTILKAEYELLGFYNVVNSSWYWGWAVELIDRSIVEDSKKMKKFPKYVKDNYDQFSKPEAEDLYFKASNPSFFMGMKSIEKLVKTSLYFLENDWYVTVCQGRDGNTNTCNTIPNNKNDNIRFEYLLIKKILSF